MSSVVQTDSPKGIYKNLVRLAVPIMLANLSQMMYNLADAFFLGRLGREAVAAASIAFNLVMFVVVVGLGLANAGTTLIAQSIGAGRQDRANFYLGQTTLVLMVGAVLFSLLMTVFGSQILQLMQVPPDTFTETLIYTRIIFAALPLMFMSFVLQAAMQGVGDSVTPLMVQLIAVTLNVALDPLLIFGVGPFPRLEVAGAAVATVIARGLGSILAVTILLRGRSGLRLQLRHLKPDRQGLSVLLRIGVPASLGQGVSALGFTVLQGVVNSFGSAVVAAFGIGNRIINLFIMPAIGLSRATSSLVGQCLGAEQYWKAKTVVRYATRSILVFITLGMTLTFFYGHSFVRFFVNDPEVISHGAVMFRIVSASVVTFALLTVLFGAFEGGGYTKPVMYLSVFRLWGLRVPLAWLFSLRLGFGPNGIWMAMFVSNLVTAVWGMAVLKRGRWLRKIEHHDVVASADEAID